VKITVNISACNSQIAMVDFYPDGNVLWIKTNGVCVQKKLTAEESGYMANLLVNNPIGKFLEIVTSKVDGFKRMYATTGSYQIPNLEEVYND